MARAYASAVIPVEVEKVWTFARDFDNLPAWHPAIVSSHIEDGSVADAVGCVRSLTMTDGGVVRERLLRLDDPARCYTYCFVESPFAVRRYESTIRFTPITETGHTFAEWWADFDADAAVEPELLTTFGQDVFATGLKALRSTLDTLAA
ncbi:SRPBCC family protein [Actinopolymorpha alba]|uniref:SRPBCC family protein n=1 Tax=Actinopolymorpha alba TaxID=533267 RepID=UPI0003793BE8|nr:SRPBCC family protein [Actinopolymorpha alba]